MCSRFGNALTTSAPRKQALESFVAHRRTAGANYSNASNVLSVVRGMRRCIVRFIFLGSRRTESNATLTTRSSRINDPSNGVL
jgi:hypothetical protein